MPTESYGNFGLVTISLRGTPCRRENWRVPVLRLAGLAAA